MTSTATKKKYGSYQEMVEDVTTLKEQNYIYEPKFEQSQAVPKETNTKSIITSFISQLRPGADLSRIQAPMFVIKPKSFLEVTSDYVAPHSFMIKVGEESAPEKRIALLGKWVLSNLSHTVQKGFARMKPFNPILGEQFLCQFNHEDSTTSFVAEQTSHHPPITSLYMENKKHNWVYTSTTAPKSTFLGNKVAMTLEGDHSFHLLKLGEVYNVTWPNIVGRGILLGTSMVENTDSVKITCEKTGYELKAELKKKGNDIEGYVKSKEGEIVYKITGNIEGKITFVDQKTKAQDTIDVKTLQPPSKIVKPLHEQLVNEARRVWHHASFAIYEGDLDTASKYKHFVEEEQRKHAKARKEKGEKWNPTLFKETSKKVRNDAPVFEYKNINLNPTSSKHEDEALLDLE